MTTGALHGAPGDAHSMRSATATARPLWRTALFIFALAAGGCAVQTQALREQPPADLPRRAELDGTPFFPQTDHQCGPAALATALSAIGLPVDPAALTEQVFLPARTGTLQVEMIAGARRRGAAATRLPTTLVALLREVQQGHPVVVLQNRGLSWAPLWHYAVLVGYDLDAAEVLMRSGATRREAMPLHTFEYTWTRAGSWAFAATPPGQWPATAQESAVVEASVGFERSSAPGPAVVVYRSALERWPDNLSLRMGLGNTLYAFGDKRAAAEAFREAARQHQSAPAWINLASTLLELGAVPDAVQAAREAVLASDDTWKQRAESVLADALRAGLAMPP